MSGAVIEAGFDYAAIDQNGRDDVKEAAVRIRLRMSRTVEDIIEIGRDLIAVKASLGHGSFGHWIEVEFGMSAVSASRFINVAERFGDKSFTVKDLPPSVLYALAAPSTQEGVVEEVLERVAAGEVVTREEVAALKAEKKELKLNLKKAKANSESYANEVETLRVEATRLRDQLHTAIYERDHAAIAPSPAPMRLEVVRNDALDFEARIASVLADFMRLPNEAKAQFLKRASSALLEGVA